MGDEIDFTAYRRKTLGLDQPLPRAYRAKDPVTARQAGESFERRGFSELHEAVLDALSQPMTDEQLERLPQFAGLGPSTVRKRRSELFALQRIRTAGTVINSRGRQMIRWERA